MGLSGHNSVDPRYVARWDKISISMLKVGEETVLASQCITVYVSGERTRYILWGIYVFCKYVTCQFMPDLGQM